MKVLIVDNHDSFTYNLVQMVEQSRVCTFEVIKNDSLKMNEIEQFDKILLSPGPGLPQETTHLFDVIKNYAQRKPILGICLGHQAIAMVFGGKIFQLKNPLHGKISKTTQTDIKTYLFDNVPSSFNTVRYHSWAVDAQSLPTHLQVTSTADDGVIMSLKHRYLSVEGIQFHPESIKTEFGFRIICNWLHSPI